ncbi:MAG: DUF4136 domain-containing protein [Bacteroidales bacterium]
MNKTALFLSLSSILMVTASCQKNPDFDQLSDNFMVYTNYDKNVTFSQYSTFYIPDTIQILGSSKVTNWIGTASGQPDGDANAEKIIKTVSTNLINCGYTQITDPAIRKTADLGMQLFYVENTYYVTSYSTPYYWYDWWWGGSWAPGWECGYPTYASTYNYKIGSLLGEMIWINQTAKTLNPIWSFYITGSLSGSTYNDIQRTVNGVEQAFKQSPYLNK